MKNLFFIISIFLIMTSCEKQQQEIVSNNDFRSLNIETRASQDGATINVQCRGNCGNPSGGGDQCAMKWDMKNDIVSCMCAENCKMIFSNSSVPPLSGSIQLSVKSVAEYFFNSMGDDIELLEIKLTVDQENLTEFIHFTYSDNLVQQSIGYLVTYEEREDGTFARAGNDSTEVDCSGSCNSSEEICTEEYFTTTGKVRCSCEGDGCKMTITQVRLESSNSDQQGG